MSDRNIPLVVLFAVLLGGCSDDILGPVSSQVITLTINSMNQSDIDPPGMLEKDENISTETGNPWGEFIKEAVEVCGADPARFEIVSASLTLDLDGSQDVDELQDVLTGQATAFFASTRGSDDDAPRVDIATGSGLEGVGPAALMVVATPAALAVLHERLVGGDFHVGIRAETTRNDETPFSLDLRVTFQARALCE